MGQKSNKFVNMKVKLLKISDLTTECKNICCQKQKKGHIEI